MAKKIMKEFTLTDISIVTDPAQAGALAAIRKSATPMENDMSKSFETRVDELRKSGMSRTDAMSQARRENPDVMKAETNLVRVDDAEPAPVRVAKSAAVAAFEKRVDQVRSTGKYSRTEAVRLARVAYPEEFEAYQAS